MIAKINSSSSVFGALSYNMNKVEDRTASVILTNNVIEDPVSGSVSMRNAMLCFEIYLLANRKTQKPVVHISINPSPEDRLNDRQLKELAIGYMQKMGYADQPYMVFKHNDIDREHIHIVSLKIDKEGKKLNDKFEKIRSMKACRELEIEHRLKQISDEKNEEVSLFIKPVDYHRGDIKRQMSSIIRSVIDNYDFQSLGEYNAILSCFNIQSKYIKGEDEDNLYHGIIYSTTDGNGNDVGNRIKSSRIGKFCGYIALSKTMLKTKDDLKRKAVPYKAKNIIAQAKAESGNKDEFINKLKLNNIDVILRVNDKGTLYGVTFIDHANRIAFNGSKIGKEYSANAMNDWLSRLADSSGTGKNILTGNTPRATEQFIGNSYHPDYSSPGAGIVTAGAPDPEEEAFIRRMKRKKKKGIKR